jgi:hypothetical protein
MSDAIWQIALTNCELLFGIQYLVTEVICVFENNDPSYWILQWRIFAVLSARFSKPWVSVDGLQEMKSL